MKNILDLSRVYNTGTVSRSYLIPWLSSKLGITDNYVIVNDNLYNRELPELVDFDTVVLDLSHNPIDSEISRQQVADFSDRHNGKNVVILSDDANEDNYTSYFHLPYSTSIHEFIDDHVQYKFSCLNSVPKIHRLIMLNKLYQHNTQQDVFHSFLWDKQQHAKNHLNTDYWKTDIAQYDTEYNYFVENLMHMCPILVDDISDKDTYLNDHSVSSPAYSQSALNIITESSHSRLFFSEKTWKPIFAKQLFMSINAPGSIAKLEEFGFDVFRDLIDHTYDQHTDLVQRVDACVAEVRRLSDDIIDIYHHTEKRRQNNFRHLQSHNFRQLVEIHP